MSIVSKFLSKCVVAVAVFVVAAVGQTPNAGWYTTDPEAESYSISTANQLAGLATLVNRSDDPVTFEGKTIILARDIDLSGYGASYDNGKGWVPIGNSESNYFGGTFDGNGKKISGMYIFSRANAGLFGHIASGAEVKKLGVVGVKISGSSLVGAIVGDAQGASIVNCYSTGEVSGSNRVGGIVGRFREAKLTKRVANSYSTCTVSGLGQVGGIVGEALEGSLVDSCVALNPSVKSLGDAGRVVGREEGAIVRLRGNVAFSAMKNIGNNTTWSNRGRTKIDGLNITGVEIGADGTLGGYFTTAAGWSVQDGKLPGFGAAVVMPEHLKPVNAQSPRIVTQPANATVDIDAAEMHILGVSATSPDGGALSYQWYRAGSASSSTDGEMIPSATNSYYAVPKDALGTYYYYVVVTNTLEDNEDGGEKAATNTSKIASINFETSVVVKVDALPPHIETHPETIQLPASSIGMAHNLTVKAISQDNSTLHYQWYMIENRGDEFGDPIPYETSPKLTVVVGEVGVTSYYVEVTSIITDNLDGGQKTATAVSKVATVTVMPHEESAVLSQAREVPSAGSVVETAIVAPITALTRGLTAGPNPVSRGRVIHFLYSGNRIESGTLTLYYASGDFVRTINIRDKGAAAIVSAITGDKARRVVGSWDLTDDKSRQVSAGSYLVKGTLNTSDGKKENVSITVGVR